MMKADNTEQQLEEKPNVNGFVSQSCYTCKKQLINIRALTKHLNTVKHIK